MALRMLVWCQFGKTRSGPAQIKSVGHCVTKNEAVWNRRLTSIDGIGSRRMAQHPLWHLVRLEPSFSCRVLQIMIQPQVACSPWHILRAKKCCSPTWLMQYRSIPLARDTSLVRQISILPGSTTTLKYRFDWAPTELGPHARSEQKSFLQHSDMIGSPNHWHTQHPTQNDWTCVLLKMGLHRHNAFPKFTGRQYS